MTNHSDSGGCCHVSGQSSTRQTLDEIDFERGIWSAACDGDESQVRKLLIGTDPSARDSAGYTALHYAARAGHTNICKILLKAGAAVNATTGGGTTALHRAAYKGHKGVVEVLLGAGADPTLQDSDGMNAAHKAAQGGRKDMLEMILDQYPQCDVKDKRGRLPVR